MKMKVDFFYAFATPHRLTVCLPNSSDKTLLDCSETGLRLAWTYDDLRNKPLAAFVTPKVDWEVNLKPSLDGQPFASQHWTRSGGWLPVLEQTFEDGQVSLRLEVVGGQTAALVRVTARNGDTAAHKITLDCEKPGKWAGYSPAWVQPDGDRDVLLAGWSERADRIIVLTAGIENIVVPAPSTLQAEWNLAPGEERSGWIVRPYKAYHAELPALRQRDWAAEFEAGKEAWRSLIGKAARFRIPDPGVQNAFLAGLADCFVMREPVADGSIVTCPGTECYRAPNSGEPLIVSVLFDQLGLHADARENTGMFLRQQGADGNWADPEGWMHLMWCASGFKSWAILEHFKLTRDKDWLAGVYQRMLASSRWQETQRAKTRVLANGQKPLTYGLMPRGMGDCGLMGEDGTFYGVFLPHNILAVYADAAAVEVAEILGREADLAELRRIHRAGLDDLLAALERGAITEDGYRWIPGVPGHTVGSRWGALYAACLCRILPPHHELVSGTIRKFEARMSPGGQPVHTGWMKDGMWVAITLDNLAEVLLLRDEGEKAAEYLYSTLNHGTPLYSWCEERGQEPGSKECAGDRQHLWTPVAVARFIRDALVMEDGGVLHLCRGAARQWYQNLAVEKAPTHFGPVSYVVRTVDAGTMDATLELPDAPVVLHLRHPRSAPIRSVTVNGRAWNEFDAGREIVVLKGLAGAVRVRASC
jgi:hypothetical protein